MLICNMPKREKSSTKKTQNMGFLQKMPPKKSFKTVFDFYIQHRNMNKSPNILKFFSTFFKKSCRNRERKKGPMADFGGTRQPIKWPYKLWSTDILEDSSSSSSPGFEDLFSWGSSKSVALYLRGQGVKKALKKVLKSVTLKFYSGYVEKHVEIGKYMEKKGHIC